MKIKLFLAITFLTAGLSNGVTIDFGTDTWNYTQGAATTGFTRANSLASGTDGSSDAVYTGYTTSGGITLRFSANFGGTAVLPTNGLTDSSGNPPGFIFGTVSNNSTSFAQFSPLNDLDNRVNTITSNLSSGSPVISSYQRWHFEFSAPIVVSALTIEDIDNLSSGQASMFRDILGAEGFSTTGYVSPYTGNTLAVGNLPTIGSGFDATFTLGSSLQEYTVSAPNGGGAMKVVSPNIDTANPSSTAAVRAGISFGTEPIKAFSLYALSNNGNVHRMSMTGASFTFIPEPSTALLGTFAATGLFIRRRR